MRIVVTGASGFVGGHLAVALSKAGHTVYSTYLRSEIADAVVRASKSCLQVDLTDKRSVGMLLEQSQPDVIIHCAAVSRIADCAKDPEAAQAVNVMATANILELSTFLSFKSGYPLILYTSTDLVFDGTTAPSGGFTEQSEPVPASLYAQTKFEAEQIVKTYGGPFNIVRLCLVYGGLIDGENAGTQPRFFNSLVADLKAEKPAKLFVDEWRTPVVIDDIIDAVTQLLPGGRVEELKMRNSIINLAGSERLTRFEFGEKVCAQLGCSTNLLVPINQPQADNRSPDVSLSALKLRELLGRPPHTVSTGLSLAVGS